jgi:hypothetical protein
LILSIIHNRIILRGSVRYSILSLRFFRSKTRFSSLRVAVLFKRLTLQRPQLHQFDVSMAQGAIHCILLGIIFVSSFYVSPIKVSLFLAHVLSLSPVPRFLCHWHKACHHSYGFDTGSYDRCLIPSGPYRTLSCNIFLLPHALWAISDFVA